MQAVLDKHSSGTRSVMSTSSWRPSLPVTYRTQQTTLIGSKQRWKRESRKYPKNCVWVCCIPINFKNQILTDLTQGKQIIRPVSVDC